MTFAKFLRAPSLTEHLRWLLLFMAILLPVTLLLILIICLFVDINFLEDTTENNFKKCQKFSGKYLWRSSILVKALSLRFTVILLMILMVLRNFIIILSALTGNFLFLVTIFLLTFHSICCMDYNYSIILLFYSITGYILLLYYSCEDYINFRKSKDQII